VTEVARFSRHMSDEDALMWNIEKDPILRSTIVAVAILDRAPDWRRLRERFAWASRVIPRLRQRVLSPPLRLGPPRWTIEGDFDLDFHLRRFRLPQPGTERALLDAVQPIATGSFDRARPLWELMLLEGLEPLAPDGTERAALVLKVHHSVTDGIGGMDLLSRLVDLEPDAKGPATSGPDPAPEQLGPMGLVRESVLHSQRRALGVARRLPATALDATVHALRAPATAASDGARTVRSIARTLAPATAPLSPLMQHRGLGRRLDVLDVGLEDLKRAAKNGSASINDAFLASVVGGFERYHDAHDTRVDALRMTLPINLRAPGETTAGNRFVPARFAVPVNIDDPRERMQVLGRLVREWREEPALRLTSALAGVLNRLPTAMTTALFGSLLKGCDFVATNVPGAPVPVYASGARVERFYAFAPPAGAAANIALISHEDRVCIGVVSDTSAIPDADLLLACLRAGFDEVLALA
jgi:WS/DGAT/MGAT family acyltransferase